ncbi:endolytic transglycosylase MltG [Luteimonas sp. 50]|uniref:Endolytic murein transglycosylase n=1 Tax=Cognatiluteimonas sedimenti TaxID=2927791 RepID=A0ABT0A069_9GAMM|nr:endolytic transglycosylase MltG [Lysobacter sedimenti]MCJ0824372.1 endolytic transglycosylase MltG [Lysobacter sedimenti]
MSPQKRKHGFGLLFVATALLAGALGYWAVNRYLGFADVPLAGLDAGDSVRVERGDSFARVLDKLHEAGIPAGQRVEWQLLARQLGAAGKLQVGEYALDPGTTPRQLLLRMREGKVISHRITIVEGWNMRELRAALARAQPLEHETAQLDDAALMAALGQPGVHPEGRFLPETYVYTRGDSDLDVLGRARAAMAEALDAAWESRVPGLPLRSKEEALVLASIVEKETGIAEERPRIAGVFVRRLELGMKLQTDPTVIYGMGEQYAGNIRRADLATDTPYNTYTRPGLPPTPIAMPGAAALQAATHPAQGDALYFVAVGDGSGRHVFTRSLAEHQAAVREYLQRYRQQRRQAQ